MLNKELLDQVCINKPQGVSGCMSQVKDTKNKGEILFFCGCWVFSIQRWRESWCLPLGIFKCLDVKVFMWLAELSNHYKRVTSAKMWNESFVQLLIRWIYFPNHPSNIPIEPRAKIHEANFIIVVMFNVELASCCSHDGEMDRRLKDELITLHFDEISKYVGRSPCIV